jgi:hypothetical protein
MRISAGALKRIHTVLNAMPVLCGALDSFVYPVIPITPLLRGYALFWLLLFCTFAAIWARRVSKSVPRGAAKRNKPLKYSIYAAVAGVAAVITYVAFSTYFDSHNPQDPTMNRVLDTLQAVLFALPWGTWSFALVVAPFWE